MPVKGLCDSRGPTGLTSQPPGSLESLANSSVVASTTSSQVSTQHTQSLELRLRIQQLEEQLSKLNPPVQPSPASSTMSNIQELSLGLGGTFHVHCENGSLGQPQTIARSVAHKTRLFGQSHWAVSSMLLVSALELTRDILVVSGDSF